MNHSKIVLVNVANGTMETLIEADDAWHPAIWIKKVNIPNNLKLDPDSAGVYLNPSDNWESVLMRFKMELLWMYRDSADVVILGSSRPMFAVSPSVLEKQFFAVNFGQTPNSIYMSRDFLDLYIFNHMKKIKYIVLSLDLDFWYKEDGDVVSNFFKTEAENYPGYVYDANHDYWKDGYPEGLLEYTVNALGSSDERDYLADRGRYLKHGCSSWKEDPEIEQDSMYLDKHWDLIENSMDALVSIIKEAKKRDIHVVGVIFPQSPAYAKTGAFGRYGLRRTSAKKLISQIDALSKKYPNFVLMDENNMGDHTYSNAMAIDEDHLCYGGANLFSSRLKDLLMSLEEKK